MLGKVWKDRPELKRKIWPLFENFKQRLYQMNNKPTFTYNTSSTLPVGISATQSAQKSPLSSQPTNPPPTNLPAFINQSPVQLQPQIQQPPFVQIIGQANTSSTSYGFGQNVPGSNPFPYPSNPNYSNVQVIASSVNNPFSNQLPPKMSSNKNWVPQQQNIVNSNNYPQQQIQFASSAPSLFQYPMVVNSDPKEGASIRLLKGKEENKKVVAIIVTFCSSMSYDQLFTQVQQKTLEGTQVLVYSCNSESIHILANALEGKEVQQNEAGKNALEIAAHTKEVDPDCVVFNWECSSGYTSEYFPEGNNQLMNFVKMIINRGHMAMFSDFSLKAFIKNWDAEFLGKNPFKRTGEISGKATLRFSPGTLKECPSSQLQLLGDLVENGMCEIQCAGNTILYTVDKDCIDTRYQLQVLTIRVTHDDLPPALRHEIAGKSGDAGHVLLRYPSGGMILTSMGHWIELMKIDPSETKLFEVAQREFGAQYAQQMQNEYNQLNEPAKAEYRWKNASNFVQNQAPCSNMNRKGYY